MLLLNSASANYVALSWHRGLFLVSKLAQKSSHTAGSYGSQAHIFIFQWSHITVFTLDSPDSHKSLLIDIQNTIIRSTVLALLETVWKHGFLLPVWDSNVLFKTKLLRKLPLRWSFEEQLVCSCPQTLSWCSLVFFQLMELLKKGEMGLALKHYRMLLVFKDSFV